MTAKKRFAALKDALHQQELMILVWGPGKDADPEYVAKRQKIRETLKTAFPRADVHFSEDDALLQALEEEMGDMASLQPHEQELFHLQACDLCVVLYASVGSFQEVAHFVHSRDASKLLALVHQKYEHDRSFSAGLLSRVRTDFYTDTDFADCHMVERIVAIATYFAARKAAFSP